MFMVNKLKSIHLSTFFKQQYQVWANLDKQFDTYESKGEIYIRG